MHTKITVCPIKVNVVGVSTTAKPVTLTALVTVKMASNQVIPALVAFGSLRKMVPKKITIIKLLTKMMAGEKLRRYNRLAMFDIP